MASVWGELKRRNVFKVGAAYAIVAGVGGGCGRPLTVDMQRMYTISFEED